MTILYQFISFTNIFLRPYWPLIILIVICLIYLILRLGWPETIEFGYDQPKMALQTQRFIAEGSFLSSHIYNDITPLGNFSWGSSFIFLLTPFFLISSDPIVVSQLIGVYNILSVVVVWYIGSRFFSPFVGLFAGFFLAVHPWWIIFSRMIYSPSMGPTLIALCILLTFMVIKTVRTRIIAVLIFIWGVLLHIYLNHLSVIFVSALGVLFAPFHRLHFRWFLIGCILLFLLYLPTFLYYFEHPNMFFAYFNAQEKFDSTVSMLERFRQVSSVYFLVLSGGAFRFQLGSAEADFSSQIGLLSHLYWLVLILITAVLTYSFFSLFQVATSDKLLRILLLLWATGPLWFLSFVRTPEIVPRYFLLSFPAFSLLFGFFMHECVLQIRHLALRVCALSIICWLLLCWIVFILYYYDFIRSYHYPSGFVSYTSDPPAQFTADAFRWIAHDARSKSYSHWIVSTRPDVPFEFGFLNAVKYYWEYVLKRDYTIPSDDKVGYYVLYYTPVRFSDLHRPRQQFGPLVVFDYTHDI